MEYQKIINLLDARTNQSKFRTRDWVEINEKSKGRYDNSNIRFKAITIRPNLCDYSDAYIPVKRTITFPNTATAGTAVNNKNKKIIFKNCAAFTVSITKKNNTQIDDTQKIDLVMPTNNLQNIMMLI